MKSASYCISHKNSKSGKFKLKLISLQCDKICWLKIVFGLFICSRWYGGRRYWNVWGKYWKELKEILRYLGEIWKYFGRNIEIFGLFICSRWWREGYGGGRSLARVSAKSACPPLRWRENTGEILLPLIVPRHIYIFKYNRDYKYYEEILLPLIVPPHIFSNNIRGRPFIT